MVKESSPMVGGDGPNSYAQNSSYQKEGADAAKELVCEGIKKNLDFENPNFDKLTTFTVADLGCSTGPNTFFAVKYIIEAVNHKYHTQLQNPPPLEFQVLFNDQTDNDFNTLFKSLSSYQNYFAAGVPGSFYSRLFPKSSIHFVNTFYALHWISKIPREILEDPALNKESICCSGLVKEAAEAYLNQFKNDIDSFLNARAEEVVGGGLMAMIIGGRRNGILMFQTPAGLLYQFLGDSLRDMAKLKVISEEKVDNFNLPLYYSSPKELEEIIKGNGHFSIENLHISDRQVKYDPETSVKFSVGTRSVFQGLLKEHFGVGENILDQIFHNLAKKIADNLSSFHELNHNNTELFILLRRNIS
ncbi:hypothetical protein JCGZ_22258 [Jatropha curcas]|uniref:Uncharacterized protein n=1 Tax=Jatropha curcas TaxID=180498 RepID=A0A067LK12_JATCU|nr:hypothetical protein JCGZ_22258 [Jatropha curcas]